VQGLCDQLLTRSAFSGNERSGGRCRQGLDQLTQKNRGLTLTDEEWLGGGCHREKTSGLRIVGKALTSENSEMALKLLIKMSIYLFINDNCDSWQEK
jgi:hypothetical protein